MDFKEFILIIYDILVFLWLSIVYIAEALILCLIPRQYLSKDIRGEVALVTGGAGGLGRLIAKKLAALGAHVIIWDIDKLGIQEIVSEIQSTGGKCTGYVCDITNKDEVYNTAKTIKIEVGNVTIVVNNAGYVCGELFMNLPDNEIERTYQVNILSHYWINKSFLKEMMKENHGHIVTIASVAGLLGTYRCTDYSATKFAAVGYHESLFSELQAHGYNGIHTTLICPYYINTGMFSGVKPRLMAMLEPEYVAEEIVIAILTNQIYVVLPNSAKFFLPLKNWLPPKLAWAGMYNLIKGPQSMMTFQKIKNQ
ncbi:short-chain dehydrogenase/reductase family 16C member 6 [Chelonus insularis]|uniref:short-chain dehydrogenase/reductase family 16C member 6 n=1 Tax=Chelonus insularis TaxID=460826 RepID=UPI00158A2C86|nr:short-chain dehydrogenase/reductase family 16C member 6 [Chelonus insularis]